MSKRWAVTCPACKFYNFPLYCIETSGFHTKTCQLKKQYPCLCLKANEKGKNDVDSLGGMRNRSNCNDLDDKIKNLRSELTSLVKEDSKSEIQSNSSNNNNNSNLNAKNVRTSSVIKHVHKSYDGKISFGEGRVDVNSHHIMHKETKPDTHSKKKDFTNWLDSTIDSLSGTPNSGGDKSKQIPAGKNKTFDTIVDGNAECLVETEYLTQDWDDLQIAQELLYESFLMQNYPCYMTPVDNEVEALPINLTKRKHERTEGRNSSAKKTKTSDRTQNSGPIKQVNNKTMGRTNQNRSDSEVEVINIDDDSNNSSSEINEVDCNDDTQKVILIEDNDTNPETESTEKENSDSKKRLWECPICFEQNTGQEVVTTMCGHVFCKKCLEDYKTYEQSCPTCRTNLRDKPLITLFNF